MTVEVNGDLGDVIELMNHIEAVEADVAGDDGLLDDDDDGIFDFDPVGDDGMTSTERTYTERGPTIGKDWHGHVTILNAQRVADAMLAFLSGKKYTWVSYQNSGDGDYNYTPSLRSGQELDLEDLKGGTALLAKVQPFATTERWAGAEHEVSPHAMIHWHDTYGFGAIHTYAMDADAAQRKNEKRPYESPYISFQHSKNNWHGIISVTFRAGFGLLTEWHMVIEPEPFEGLQWVTPHVAQLGRVGNILVNHAERIVTWEDHDFNYPKAQNGDKKRRAAEILAKAKELAALIEEAEHEWGPEPVR